MPRPAHSASLKRPSSSEFTIDFEGTDLPCDFALGDVVRDQYWSSTMARLRLPCCAAVAGVVLLCLRAASVLSSLKPRLAAGAP